MLSLCPASVLGSLAPPRGEPLRPRHLSTTVCARGPVHEPRECERETRTPYGRTPICVPPPPSLAHACSARVRRRSAACRVILVRLSSTLRRVPAPSRAAPSTIPCVSLQAVRTAAILSTVCHQFSPGGPHSTCHVPEDRSTLYCSQVNAPTRVERCFLPSCKRQTYAYSYCMFVACKQH